MVLQLSASTHSGCYFITPQGLVASVEEGGNRCKQIWQVSAAASHLVALGIGRRGCFQRYSTIKALICGGRGCGQVPVSPFAQNKANPS